MQITIKPKTAAPKAAFQTLTKEEFRQYREKVDKRTNETPIYTHEIMGKKIRPTFDFDHKCLTEDEFARNKVVLNAAKQQIVDRFPKAKYPHVKIVDLVSSGPTQWEVTIKEKDVKTGKVSTRKEMTDAWKISAHFVVLGVGSWPLAKVKKVAETFDVLKTSWDLGIYTEGKTLRMAYCTKEGERRFLERAVIGGGDVKLYKNAAAAIKDLDEEYNDWIMTDFDAEDDEDDEEEEVKEKKAKKKVESDSESDDESEDEEEEDWKSWTYERAQAVIERLNDDRAATHKDRINGICSILHLAKALRKTKSFHELAHLFAKKDPEYDEAQTDEDWKYFKARKPANPRTFASLIKQANEDNPEEAEPEVDAAEIPVSYYDKKRDLLVTKPKLKQIEHWMVGCLRLCPEDETWYTRKSTGGWDPIPKNRNNFPFGSATSNTKFEKTTFFDILDNIKDVPACSKVLEIRRPSFNPLHPGEKEDPNSVNLWTGWGWKTDLPSVETEAVKQYRDATLALFPKCGEYLLDCEAYKLRYPRSKCKLIIGYGRFGAEGKNTKQNITSRIFGGSKYCISTPDSGHILGKGDQNFNGGIENKLVCFLQEGKAEGKSITDDDKMKNFLSEDTYPLRSLNKNPVLDNPNYIWTWLWTNNRNSVNMPSPMLYRTMAEAVSAAKMDDKEHFARLRAIAADDNAIQEIFTWLWNRDLSKFDINAIPDTPFKSSMAENSLTTTQRYIVDVCNGRRDNIEIDPKKVTKVLKTALYDDYRRWAEAEGLQPKYRAQLKNFTEEVKNLDIICKEARLNPEVKGTCFHFDLEDIEKIMRKFQRNPQWKLLVDEPAAEHEAGDEDDMAD